MAYCTTFISSATVSLIKKYANIWRSHGMERWLCFMELRELPSSELELEWNCRSDLLPESEFQWNCLYRNWNWNLTAKTESTPALRLRSVCLQFQTHQVWHREDGETRMKSRLGVMKTPGVVLGLKRPEKEREDHVEGRTTSKGGPRQRQDHVKERTMSKGGPCQREDQVKGRTKSKGGPCQREDHVKERTMSKGGPIQREDHVKGKTMSKGGSRQRVDHVKGGPCQREDDVKERTTSKEGPIQREDHVKGKTMSKGGSRQREDHVEGRTTSKGGPH